MRKDNNHGQRRVEKISKYRCVVPGCSRVHEALDRVSGTDILSRARDGQPALYHGIVAPEGKRLSVEEITAIAFADPAGFERAVELVLGANSKDRGQDVRDSRALCWLHYEAGAARAAKDSEFKFPEYFSACDTLSRVLDELKSIRAKAREEEKKAAVAVLAQAGDELDAFFASCGPQNSEATAPDGSVEDEAAKETKRRAKAEREGKRAKWRGEILRGEIVLNHRKERLCSCKPCLEAAGYVLDEGGNAVLQPMDAQAPEDAASESSTVVVTGDPGVEAEPPKPDAAKPPVRPIFAVVRGDVGTGTPPSAKPDAEPEARSGTRNA